MGDHDEIWVIPGFRFYPTEEELICFYLHQKLQGGRRDIDRVIPEIYIYNYNPWDLPNLSGERCRNDPQLQEWFFFIPKHEKEVKGGRPNRLTSTGYWKATGSPGYVFSSTGNNIIGVKRTMVFYNGRARSKSGSKTQWKMHEYMAVDNQSSSSTNPPPSHKGDFTICRVYIKSKCLRAFDRRPAAPTITRPVIIAPQANNNGEPSSSNPQPHNRARPRFISSDSSSASEDQATDTNNPPSQPTNNEQDNTLNMEIDQQTPLWDSDWDWMVHWNI